jgi:hypothetical protein
LDGFNPKKNLPGFPDFIAFFKGALFIFYTLVPLIALINISSRDFKPPPQNDFIKKWRLAGKEIR